MSNSNDKPNGVESNPLQRLASLKAPRDLLLGGVKPNKKVFTPNLNVARNKNKGPSTAATREQKKDERNKRDRKNDKNKNFKNGPNIIKSSGVFSEGIGSAERHSSRASYGSGREANTAPTLQKPTIRIKDAVRIDTDFEEQKIKAILSENGNEIEEAEDFKTVLDADAPVKLPMDDGGWSINQKPSVTVKQEVIVKQEPTEDGDLLATPEEKPIPDIKDIFEDTNVANLLKSDKPTLILLQLSDTLPGRGGSGDEDRKKPINLPSTSEETEQKPVDTRCHLSDLEEGRIGKLRVHRSGRVTLALGSTIFEVCSGTKASFYQEVVSVNVNDASRSANLVSLGPLQHKLNITPHWQAMFDEMSI
ncbi:DNA-directed RNA polymerase III subunit RPC4 isoform X1 [Colias croceus]|uniref:DNA-directed RNA polymerase III subunit RPC4 isoform X1 n=1 Tax=Colias crocea TaxID=72248 RepID=UPI001E27ACE3|nr:DNA-directed RNA polymerase III subunit RPC4 isoform X1 [Colias croceus]XP_045504269.1 DNA-directed RNA polymerase III subunit RPC4 isoform X1 [Colias croceus]